MPSYVGIAGSTNDSGFPETRVNACCQANLGQISGGGVLIPNAAVAMRDITDGTSTTICVGEVSGFLYDAAMAPKIASGGNPNGWMMGTSGGGIPPNFINGANNVPCWNITTIKYAPGTRDYTLPGISNASGWNANYPLISAHTDAVHVLLADGSVRMISDEVDMPTLRQLATRDDGQVVGEY